MRPIPYDVRLSLSEARDEQITRVVAMVDAMPQRDAADALIAPLRQRLAQLRPSRPLTFTRLLFLPLDPVIVPGPRWRRGTAAVPRTALAPMAQHVRRLLDAAALADIEAEMARGASGGAARVGAALWPASAAVLASAPAPANWTAETGIPQEDYGAIAKTVVAVLRRAVLVDAVCGAAGPAADRALDELLSGLGDAPDLVAAVLPILLERHAQPDQVLGAVRTSGLLDKRQATAEAAARNALEAADAALTGLGGAELAAAGAQLGRIASLLAGFDGLRPGGTQAETTQMRRRADEACREQLSKAIAHGLLEPLAAAAGAPSDEEMARLEAVARDVRRLETIGRQLGSPAAYSALVHRAIARLAGDGAAALPVADRVRLVELLGGADAAWAVLGKEGLGEEGLGK